MTGRRDLSPSFADALALLRTMTRARIGLGRVGAALPNAALLSFQLDHGQARDAVHTPIDMEALSADMGKPVWIVDSRAGDRLTYLQRPDLGRRLDEAARLPEAGDYDLAIVVGDGLSAFAAQRHAAPLVANLCERLRAWRIAPIVLARNARVALGDEIGERLGARLVLVLIGERPGLAASDSLGAYLTYRPRVGRRDHERNCISNIRPEGGLDPIMAAANIAWLLQEADKIGESGISLKDRFDPDALPTTDPARALPDTGSRGAASEQGAKDV